ncbi:MAG: hypothetical protein WBA05_17135 [Gordonia sp. (in: high G+C Gram-positive bacteria)]|uniref:hypothetical protein n=1 Tax=Gordonia TaxID=2053 RepID=UPI0032650987
MCQQATCRTCGKTTWRGCGRHVDQVMRGVPAAKRCAGHPKEPGLFARLFGGK